MIATGLARGAAARGKKIAFGSNGHIMWSSQDHEIFHGNPNIAPPGSERAKDLEWIDYRKGHRLYGTVSGGRWIFRDFKCVPGQVFFTDEERTFGLAARVQIVLEPRVKPRGACDGSNKSWGVARYQALADELRKMGYQCAQLVPPGQPPLLNKGVAAIYTRTFRLALAVLQHAQLFVGPEGGLHHGAAMANIPAVVLFGGFNTPRSTGYDTHTNIVVGDKPCGSIAPCRHCQDAMASISVEQVLHAALAYMRAWEMAE